MKAPSSLPLPSPCPSGLTGSVDQFNTKVVHGTRYAHWGSPLPPSPPLAPPPSSCLWVPLRFLMVDCLLYPCSVFSRQCQVFPYTPSSPSVSAPLSSLVVMHNIAHTQVGGACCHGKCMHGVPVMRKLNPIPPPPSLSPVTSSGSAGMVERLVQPPGSASGCTLLHCPTGEAAASTKVSGRGMLVSCPD